MTIYNNMRNPLCAGEWRTHFEHRFWYCLLVDHDELDRGGIHAERSVEGQRGRKLEHGT